MKNHYQIIDDVLAGSTDHSEETVYKAAIASYNNQPAHRCYWNNRFYLAVKFNLPQNMKQEAALRAVGNGESGYWEWKTHSDYDMVQCLRDIGITEGVPESLSEVPRHLYISVDPVVMKQIKAKFNL